MTFDYDPFPDDELMGEDAGPEPSPEQKLAILALAGASMDAYFAERGPDAPPRAPRPPSHVAEPFGPRQRKKRARKLLFDGLRRGLAPGLAADRAGISPETLALWMERPSFVEAVRRAGRIDVDEWTPRLD